MECKLTDPTEKVWSDPAHDQACRIRRDQHLGELTITVHHEQASTAEGLNALQHIHASTRLSDVFQGSTFSALEHGETDLDAQRYLKRTKIARLTSKPLKEKLLWFHFSHLNVN